MNIFILALIVLACARVTHLLADDYVLSKPRDWYLKKTENKPYVNYLATCTWCMSIWVAVLGAYLSHRWAGVDGAAAWLLIPALSYTTAILESLVEFLYGDD